MVRYSVFFSSRRRHTRCALVTGVQTCALPISAADIGTDFDRYWQSRSSHPIARIVEDQEQNSLDRLISDAAQARKSTEGRRYAERLRNSNFVSRIEAGRLTFEWTKVYL